MWLTNSSTNKNTIYLYTNNTNRNNNNNKKNYLTHWGRVTHICVVDLTIIGSDNGLWPGRRQAIIWPNAGILLIGPLGTNLSEILIVIQTFPLKKIRLKMPSVKCCSFRLGLNELSKTHHSKLKTTPHNSNVKWHQYTILGTEQNGYHFANANLKWLYFDSKYILLLFFLIDKSDFFQLTHCPLGDVPLILEEWFSTSLNH